MLRAMKWSFYLFMAFAGFARCQTEAPKDQGKSDARYFHSHGNMYRSLPAGNGMADFYFDYPAQSPDQQPGQFAYYEVGDRTTGMSLAAVDDAVREHLKLPKGQGLIATSVAPQGMAARAGICENDILLTLGDAPLGKAEDLEERLKAAGDKPLGLVLLHQGSKKTVQVQPHLRVTFGPVQPQPPAFWIGVSVSLVEPALRSQLRLPADQGLIVTEVIAEGPAAKSGLKVNDILLTMAGKPLKDQAALIDLVQKNGEKAAAVEILREGSRMTIEVTPRRRQPSQTFTARLHPSTFRWDVVRPGVVLQNNAASSDLTTQYVDPSNNLHNLRWIYQQPEADSLSKRLDNVSAEIKELRKAIDELSKALKDRK